MVPKIKETVETTSDERGQTSGAVKTCQERGPYGYQFSIYVARLTPLQ